MLLAVSGLWLAAGCQQARRAPPRVEGASSFQFVERPITPAAEAAVYSIKMVREPVDVKVKAEPIEPLSPPVYPRVALGRVRRPMTVGVRITVDDTGRVAQVGPSLVAFSTGGEWAEEFRVAVEEALAQWRFKPAEFRHMEPRASKTGRGGYWQVTRSQPTDDGFDLAFTFTAKGDVLTEGLR
jgi:hypothetical protein